jgi:predicted transcriptional regulator
VTDLDRTTVILSIQPVYVERIFDGRKTIEFRRKPIPKGATQALIWQTAEKDSPGGIVGRVRLMGHSTLPARLWDSARGKGIGASALAEYAGGYEADVTGYYLEEPQKLDRKYTLGYASGPQHFRYAPTNWRSSLPFPWPGDAPSIFDSSCAPGGMVCSACGTPVESQPCQEHQPRAWEAID